MMSSRKPGYLIGLILLAIVSSFPQVNVGYWLVPFAVHNRAFVRLRIPGLGETHEYGNTLMYAPLWQDRFVYHGNALYDGSSYWRFAGIDPESGKSSEFGFGWRGPGGHLLRVYGDRLFLASYPMTKLPSAEVIEGQACESKYIDIPYGLPISQHFLLNGEPARIEFVAPGFVVSTIQGNSWVTSDSVVLPDKDRDWTFGATQIDFQRVIQIYCLNQGDGIHLFLNVDGCLFYRNGLDLEPRRKADGSLPVQTSTERNLDEAPASALEISNAEAQRTGWTLVRGAGSDDSKSGPVRSTIHVDGGMLVEGLPAALIVDEIRPGELVGSVYRFNGSDWSLFVTQAFPFGANHFRAVVCRDGQSSYVVASTTLGLAHVYAVDAQGIRATQGGASLPFLELRMRLLMLWVPVYMLEFGLGLGLGAWLLMWWYTKPDYEFGTQSVKLASLGRRGLARLIDLALIVLTSAGLGWVLTRDLDWLSLLEALNLHIDHPIVHAATRVGLAVGTWLVVVVLFFVVLQGRYGVTPGKWCCGVKLVRTTLRPCGLARSLVREVLMSVDTCHLLWWAPGILSIAVTNHRQRLGDLVADTIAVESRTIQREANSTVFTR